MLIHEFEKPLGAGLAYRDEHGPQALGLRGEEQRGRLIRRGPFQRGAEQRRRLVRQRAVGSRHLRQTQETLGALGGPRLQGAYGILTRALQHQ